MALSDVHTIAGDHEPLNENFDSSPEHVIGYVDGPDETRDGHKRARELIGATLQKHIRAINPHDCDEGADNAFFVADLGEVYRQHLRFKRHLPRVTPHFAVKCNPDANIMRLLAALGSGFDCASKAEIDMALNAGVDSSRIIYAQPCKTKSHLRHAWKQGVRQMTFDNADELHKVKEIFPHAELLLRIATDDSASLCRLSQKFGASMDVVPSLLSLAQQLELKVVGVAFHVGSGASDPGAFRKAVIDGRTVFDQALELGFKMHTLDVGGGFVPDTFDEMSAVLSTALDAYFPVGSARIIAEPGRYYTSAAFTIACNVIARRTVEDPDLPGSNSYMLYLNDGVYGNFSSIIFDHQHPVPQVLSTRAKPDGFNYLHAADHHLDSGYNSAEENVITPSSRVTDDPKRLIDYSVWGPTCDGIDCIAAQWTSPETIDIGDWLYFEEMGAYTKCCTTRFNGFASHHETIYVCSEPAIEGLIRF